LPELRAGSLLLAELLDGDAVRSPGVSGRRSSPAPESLVVFDELGAGEGQLIAVSEGREATMPFYPEKMPIDAYAAAIIDNVHIDEKPRANAAEPRR
ncbi:MAG: EutN/CcmL family microcompartment protein, partial [Phycisphaeraceae bacterium]